MHPLLYPPPHPPLSNYINYVKCLGCASVFVVVCVKIELGWCAQVQSSARFCVLWLEMCIPILFEVMGLFLSPDKSLLIC